MIEHLKKEVERLLPLRIKVASFVDPTLTLAGDGWSFSTGSAWRVTAAGVLTFGWSDPTASRRVLELCGRPILSVAAQSPRMGGDPAFELSDGYWLEVFSDQPTDPWSLQLPSITFVGSPSDPAQVV
ncbi:MAG: hypothetical protein KDB60_13805 [Propionibacteriaceae bacterium]|nr:hypothetical protein [Propionibacteriaceae bacterium]